MTPLAPDLVRPHLRPHLARPHELEPAEAAWITPLLPGPDPAVTAAAGDTRPIIPVCDTRLDGNERRYVLDCIDSGWISSAGPYIERFEHAFAKAIGTEHAIACANGTVALHLLLAAAGLGPGDEVIVPSFTMAATAAAVAYTGATPVFVDVLPGSGNIDPAAVAAAVTPATRAVVAVHIYGRPVDVDALRAVLFGHDIDLIEDAAEAHGATWEGRPVGSLGRGASFSFYANKIVTTGEGGMVTTNDAPLASVARTLRDHAFSAERHFWHRHLGFNYRMTAMQAAVGLAQVERLDELVAAKRRMAARYSEGLAGLPLRLPAEGPGERNVHWMYAVRVADDSPLSRDELRSVLAHSGIETRTFFVPLHLQPIWRSRGVRVRLPVSEALSLSGLYLPSGPGLTEADIDRVVMTVRGALAVRS